MTTTQINSSLYLAEASYLARETTSTTTALTLSFASMNDSNNNNTFEFATPRSRHECLTAVDRGELYVHVESSLPNSAMNDVYSSSSALPNQANQENQHPPSNSVVGYDSASSLYGGGGTSIMKHQDDVFGKPPEYASPLPPLPTQEASYDSTTTSPFEPSITTSTTTSFATTPEQQLVDAPPVTTTSSSLTTEQEMTTRTNEENDEDTSSSINSTRKRSLPGPEQDPETTESTSSIVIPTTTFADIIGHGAVKLRLDEILLPLALPPPLVSKVLCGIRSTSASILLSGPPGCGKTQLAQACAGQLQAAFVSVQPSSILSKFVGDSEASLRHAFQTAHAHAKAVESHCAVLFLDEMDALGPCRDGSANSSSSDVSSKRLLSELLIQLNQLHNNHHNHSTSSAGSKEDEDDNTPPPPRVIVIAATNRPNDCDPALLRRFAIRIHVGLPSRKHRVMFLQKYLQGIDHTLSAPQLSSLARATQGWSGCDLEQLTREACMTPIRECIRRAAQLKRRRSSTMVQPQQHGGTSSCQANDVADTSYAYETNNNDENDEDPARAQLLKEFQSLRPVQLSDFETAVAFLTSSTSTTATDFEEESGSSKKHKKKQQSTPKKKQRSAQYAHYDSSSSEEDDDDDEDV